MYSLYNGVSPTELEPSEFSIGQNYPNPFKEKTIIKYCIAYKTRVQIIVYDCEGKLIEKLIDEEKQPGTYEVEFNSLTDHSGKSKNLLDGYYFYQMIAGDYSSEKKWLCINNLLRSNKMKTLLQFLFFFLLTTQICFGQWYEQNSGTTQRLNAVYFINQNTGWVVGDSGTILKTTNEGLTWEEQTSGTTIDLNDVQFINESNGWIVGGSMDEAGDVNALLHTTDGGVNWIQQIDDTSLALLSIYFLNENLGWISGFKDTGSYTYLPIILKTTNSGSNWLLQTITVYAYPLFQTDLFFVSSNVGYLVYGGGAIGFGSFGFILKTTNGGENWDGPIWPGNPLGLTSISFFNEQIGIIGTREYGNILLTHDGGINWIVADSAGFAINSVTFVDLNHAWAVGYNWPSVGTIWYSSDIGVNWSGQVVFSDPLNGVYFIDSNNGWAVGDSGTVLHTTNGGVTFIDNELTQPTEFILEQNYPNPFNPSTSIQYAISSRQFISLKVYDVLGNEIETIVSEEKSAGIYKVTWYAENLPSGVYFYQLKASNYIETKKMLLLK